MSVTAPTPALEREFGNLLRQLENRTGLAENGHGTVVSAAVRDDMVMRDTELLNDSFAGSARNAVLSEQERKRQEELDSLVVAKYTALSDEVDIGEVVDLPTDGDDTAVFHEGRTSPYRSRSASRSRSPGWTANDTEGQTDENPHDDDYPRNAVVNSVNARHNRTIAEHRDKWGRLKAKLVGTQIDQTGPDGVDLGDYGQDQEITAAEARSNWPRIRKIVQQRSPTVSEDDGSDVDLDADDPEGSLMRRKAKNLNSSVKGGEGLFGDGRLREYQKQLNEAMATIARLKEEHKRRMAEMKLNNELAMKAFQAAFQDNINTLKEQLDHAAETERRLRQELAATKEDLGRRLNEALDRLDLEITAKDKMEERFNIEREELRTDLEAANAEVRRLKKELAEEKDDRRRENDLQELERRKMDAKTADLEDEVAKLKRQLTEEKVARATAEQSAEVLQQAVERKEAEMIATKENLVAAETAAQDLKMSRETFEKSVWANFEDQVSNLVQEKESVTEERNTLAKEKAELQDEVVKLGQSLKEVETQRRQMKNILSELQKAQRALQQQNLLIDAVQRRKLELLCRNFVLRAQVTRLGRTTTLQKRINDLEEQNEWLFVKLRHFQKRHVKDNSSSVASNSRWFSEGSDDDAKDRAMEERYKHLTGGEGLSGIVFEKDVGIQLTPQMLREHHSDSSPSTEEQSPLSLYRRDPFVTVGTQTRATGGTYVAGTALSPELQRYMAASPLHHPSVVDTIQKSMETLVEGFNQEDAHAKQPALLPSMQQHTHPRPISATSNHGSGLPRPVSAASKKSVSVVRPQSATSEFSVGSNQAKPRTTRPTSAATSIGVHSVGGASTSSHLQRALPTPIREATPDMAVTGSKSDRTIGINPYIEYRGRDAAQRSKIKRMRNLGAPEQEIVEEMDALAVGGSKGYNRYSLHTSPMPGQDVDPSPEEEQGWLPTHYIIGTVGTSVSGVGGGSGGGVGASRPSSAVPSRSAMVDDGAAPPQPTRSASEPQHVGTNAFEGFKPANDTPVGTWRPQRRK